LCHRTGIMTLFLWPTTWCRFLFSIHYFCYFVGSRGVSCPVCTRVMYTPVSAEDCRVTICQTITTNCGKSNGRCFRVHVTFTIRKETCPPVHINKVHVPQQNVTYLGLHLDRRLTLRKHTSTNRKELGMTLTKMYWLLGRKSKLSTSNKILTYKQTPCPLIRERTIPTERPPLVNEI
jgi:hypothetical protein